MALDRNVFTPAYTFAIVQRLTTDEVIEMIKEGTLNGQFFDDQWFVDTTAAQTRAYLRDQKYLSIGSIIKISGIISIIFGAIAGIALLNIFSKPVVSFLSVEKGGGLTFSEFAIALGVALFYCVLGVLCLGLSKVLERQNIR